MKRFLQLKMLLIGLIIANSSLVTGQVSNPIADASFKAWNDSYLLTKDGLTLYRAHLGNEAFDGTWTLAIDIQCAEDVYERTGLQKDKDLVAALCNSFLLKERPPYNWDGWNDDLAWMGLVLARGSQMTGITAHMDVAEDKCFDLAFDRGWDTTFNDGGIWEEQPDYSNNGGTTLKEPLSNNPNGHLACLIYQGTGKQEYLDKALMIHQWSRSHLFNPKTGFLNNGVRPDGSINGGDPVYNYGSFIDFLVSLYQITGDEQLIRDAVLAADYTIANKVNGNGIINNTAAYLDTYAGEFARGLGHLCKERPELWKKYYPFLKKNADAAWANRRMDLNLTWNGWDTPTPLDAGVKVTKYVSTVDLMQYTPTIQNPMAVVESDSYNYAKGVTFAEANNRKFAESIDKDDWLDYIVDVPADGNYTISFDVAGTGTGSFGLQFNHKTLQTVQVPNTGGLENYQTVNVGIKLEKGIQSIRILGITGGYRLDKWLATASSTITPYVNVNSNGLQNTANASASVGNSIQLSPQSTGVGTWSWTGPNSFAATGREINLSNIQLSHGGKYSVKYTTNEGLISTQDFMISLTGCNPTQIVTEIVANEQVFTTDLVTIEAGTYVRIKPLQVDGTWSWVGPNNFTANTAEISFNSIGYKQAGVYTAEYTNTNGCKSSKTIEIVLTGKDPCGTPINPYVNVGGWKNKANATVAMGSTIQFGPQPGSGGSWAWTGPNGFTANTREFQISNFSAANVGIYKATYTNVQGCKSTIDFAVSLEGCVAGASAVPVIKVNGADWLNGDTVIVPSGQSLSITFPGLGEGSVSWIRPRGITEFSNGFVVEKATSYIEGDYVFNVIGDNSCSSTRTVHVQVSGNDFCSDIIEPNLNINNGGWNVTSTAIFNIGDRIEFGPRVAGATSGYRWTWTFNGTELQSGKDSRVLILDNMIIANAGVYTLTTTNSTGCRSYMDFNINYIYSNCAPTSVTPNIKINTNDWKEGSSAMLVGLGENVSFSPQPTTGGNWTWTGPNGYTSTSREISFSNIQSNQLGAYKAKFTNGCGTPSFLDFIIGNILEAENATITNGVIENGTTENGVSGKFVNLEGGGKLVWGVTASETASHVIEFKIGVPSTSSRSMGVFVNGVKAGVVTSSYIGYETQKITATLNKGNNTIELRDSENTSELNVDYIKIVLAPSLGLEDNSTTSKNGFSIYPNPNNGIFNIELNGEQYNSLKIFTINGMLVYSKQIKGESALKIDISSIAKAGVYMVSLQSENEIETRKIIIK